MERGDVMMRLLLILQATIELWPDVALPMSSSMQIVRWAWKVMVHGALDPPYRRPQQQEEACDVFCRGSRISGVPKEATAVPMFDGGHVWNGSAGSLAKLMVV